MALYIQRIFICFVIVFFSFRENHVFASSNIDFPPDTINLLDKTAAAMLIDNALQLYAEGRNKDAINTFKEAANRDPLNWKPPYYISQGHYNLSNYGYALNYAKNALALDSQGVDKDVYELIGRCYHRLNNIDSALLFYNRALDEVNGIRAKELNLDLKIKQCEFVKQEIANGKVSKRQLIEGINSGYNDYGAILTNGGKELYFTSRRNNTIGSKMNEDDQEFFEDVYHAVLNSATGTWDSISNELNDINSEAFDAITYISSNGRTALMTINKQSMESKETRGSDIFIVEKNKKNKWGSPDAISNKTINTTYFDGSATMTEDQQTMYFVSDRNADRSSTDIFVVQKVNDNWGQAKPLPNNINSPGRETTPFITPDGKYLFFSSDGFVGVGGLDIYVSENLGEKGWSDPINLGLEVNTVNNDSHFYYYPEIGKALISIINLSGQKGSLDIYEVDMSKFSYPVQPK
jgi:hypothetical protein